MNTVNYYQSLEAGLLQKRTILIGDSIDSVTANQVILKLLFLEKESNNKITILINCYGGSVYDGIAILDTMDFIKNKGIIIETLCIGKAASMAGVILTHGTFGYRKSLKSSMIMLHQPLVSFKEVTFTETSLEIQSRQMSFLRQQLEKIICLNTGHSIGEVNRLLNEDLYFTPEEAMLFGTRGIIDGVIGNNEIKEDLKEIKNE